MIGFLLAGIGHRNAEGQNFLVVKPGNFRVDHLDLQDLS